MFDWLVDTGVVAVGALREAVAEVTSADLPSGCGAAEAIQSDLSELASAIVSLSTRVARLMAAVPVADRGSVDPVGAAVRAGLPVGQARMLRRVGLFAAEHPDLEASWLRQEVTTEQVSIVAAGCRGLSPDLASLVVDTVVEVMPGLTVPQTKDVVSMVRDQVQPEDPDHQQEADYRSRHLIWSQYRGGVSFQGYLPALEGGAFMAVINAYVESLRSEGDGHTMAQRRADALATLVANSDRVPTGGGLPAAVTLTVSLTEAERVAARDPQGARIPPDLRADPGRFGDAALRFAMCSAEVTPILIDQLDEGSLLARIGATRVEPLVVGRSVRLATTAQRKALRLRDGGCLVPDCTIDAAYTQPHHVVGWALGGPSDLHNYASLCWAHHRHVELGLLKITKATDGSWTITPRGP